MKRNFLYAMLKSILHPNGFADLDSTSIVGNLTARSDGTSDNSPRDAAEKWPKSFLQLRGDEWAAFFGAENAMVMRTHVGHGGN
jgi:hypothetical protein